MSTYSETVQARYQAKEEERDDFGRVILVQRLRPWDRSNVLKVADSNSGFLNGQALVAGSVRSITDEAGKEALFAPPRSEDDLQIIINALDDEGLAAATKAFNRIMGGTKAGAPVDEVETAKN